MAFLTQHIRCIPEVFRKMQKKPNHTRSCICFFIAFFFMLPVAISSRNIFTVLASICFLVAAILELNSSIKFKK